MPDRPGAPQVCLEADLRALGAALGAVLRLTDDARELELVWSFGLSEEFADTWRRLSVTANPSWCS